MHASCSIMQAVGHRRPRSDSSSEGDIPAVVPSAHHFSGLADSARATLASIATARSSSSTASIRGTAPLCRLATAEAFVRDQLPKVCMCPKRAAQPCHQRVTAGMVQRRAVSLNGLSKAEKEERICNELRGMYNGGQSIAGGFNHRYVSLV